MNFFMGNGLTEFCEDRTVVLCGYPILHQDALLLLRQPVGFWICLRHLRQDRREAKKWSFGRFLVKLFVSFGETKSGTTDPFNILYCVINSNVELGRLKSPLYLQRFQHQTGRNGLQVTSHTCSSDVSLIINPVLAADKLRGRGHLASSDEDSQVIVESSHSPAIVNGLLGPTIVGAHLLFPLWALDTQC